MRNFSGPILNEQLKKFGSYLRFDNSSKTYDVFTRANSILLFKQGILQKKKHANSKNFYTLSSKKKLSVYKKH